MTWCFRRLEIMYMYNLIRNNLVKILKYKYFLFEFDGRENLLDLWYVNLDNRSLIMKWDSNTWNHGHYSFQTPILSEYHSDEITGISRIYNNIELFLAQISSEIWLCELVFGFSFFYSLFVAGGTPRCLYACQH